MIKKWGSSSKSCGGCVGTPPRDPLLDDVAFAAVVAVVVVEAAPVVKNSALFGFLVAGQM
jgi:hypothetical protein